MFVCGCNVPILNGMTLYHIFNKWMRFWHFLVIDQWVQTHCTRIRPQPQERPEGVSKKINQNKIIVLASSFTNCTSINHEPLFKEWLFFSRLEKTKTNTKTTCERLRVYKVRNDVRGKIIEVNEVNCTWALFIEELVIKPGKHQRSKQRCQDLCWKVHDPAHNLLFCAHTLCMNNVTNTFLLVGSSVRSKQLLCFLLCWVARDAIIF